MALITRLIGGRIQERHFAALACRLCQRTGQVSHSLDITADGNTRVSILGFEPSAVPCAGLEVHPHERYRVFTCAGCQESFIEGPEPD